MMKKLVIASITLIVIAAAGYSQRASIAERLLAAGLPKQMSTNQVERLEDGLHVALCGAGGPMGVFDDEDSKKHTGNHEVSPAASQPFS
mgnify:CR=1 FL=1